MAKSSFFNGTGVSTNYISDLEIITDEVKGHKDAAASSAASAAAAAQQIAADANVASNNASAAQASATLAANSVADAADSATQAENSKVAAAASELQAASFESLVDSHLENASASASLAAASEIASDASEVAALASKVAAQAARVAAESAQASASTHDSNASTSASEASTSASQASDSAALANTKANQADAAKVLAQTAKTNAETAEANAGTSASTATAQAGVATTQAGVATTQAGVATAQAGEALVSAANAASSDASAQASKDAALEALDSLSDALSGANNLSDVASVSTSRTNLGLGTAATTASTDYATAAQGSTADSALQPDGDGSALTGIVAGLAWARKTSNYTSANNDAILADTSGGVWTLTLPSSPGVGDLVRVLDGSDWATNNLTVARNGSTVEGDAADLVMNIGGVSVDFVYDGSTWQVYAQVGVSSGTVVTEAGTQTLTNKTLDDPSFSNAVFTGDGSALTGIVATTSGAVSAFAFTSVPTGWLECDGSTVSRTTYSDLFTAIGDTFGAGDGSTTFAIPDLRGPFIRGWDNGRGIDAGRVFGSSQDEAFASHQHIGGRKNYKDVQTAYGSSPTSNGPNSSWSNGTYQRFQAKTSFVGGDETRPRNIAMMYCIKF